MKQRKTPERMCVACGARSFKGDLMRIARTRGEGVVPDPSGKMPGRGAYICSKSECVDKALKQKRFDRALRTSVPPDLAEQLRAALGKSGEMKK
ncbi:MAG: YlxR family protein [Armatimonadota bacterium]|nr:YlxR family protein [Armatimonadota bacterium]